MTVRNLPLLVTVLVGGALVVLMIARLFSPDDDWRCESGTWVRHGQPSQPVPTKPCTE